MTEDLKFSDLNDGDVVSLNLNGTFRVTTKRVGKFGYIELVSRDGYANWSFDPFDGEEDTSWNISRLMSGPKTEDNSSE